MPDPHYPCVDYDFLDGLILASGKVIPESKLKVGNTTSYVIEGNKALHKRFIVIRELEPKEIPFEIATGLAIRLGFMGSLLPWFEEFKNWKDGAYIVP